MSRHKTDNPIKARVFIVGCPRSGTTLLLSLLSAHSQVRSFPESHFLKYLYKPIKPCFNDSNRLAHKQLEDFLRYVGRYNPLWFLPVFKFFPTGYIKAFIGLLDSLAEEKGKRIWVEKTPENLFYIERLRASGINARFIHMVRNGENVVASMYEASRKAPDIFEGEKSIDECIKIWKEHLTVTIEYGTFKEHFIVRYEDLVDAPGGSVKRICQFLDIRYESQMLDNFHEQHDKHVLAYERWKFPHKIIKNFGRTKFEKIFTKEQQNYILDRIHGIKPENMFCKVR